MDIIPAILPKSLNELRSGLEHVRGVSSLVQIDVVDGVFAKNKTWPYCSGQREEFMRIVEGEEGMPLWDVFDFQIDLMVTHSLRDAVEWVAVGASSIVVHTASEDALKTFEYLQNNRVGEFKVSIGIAVSSESDPKILFPFIKMVDFIQVMGIARVGEQGQMFDERAVRTVHDIHAAYPELIIQVDGGVNTNNTRRLFNAGASRLVVGSVLVRAVDPITVAQDMRAMSV